MPSAAPPHTFPLSLHDALPILARRILLLPSALPPMPDPVAIGSGIFISAPRARSECGRSRTGGKKCSGLASSTAASHRPGSERVRSEEHTSELQSRGHLVCRLLRHLTPSLFPSTTLFRS